MMPAFTELQKGGEGERGKAERRRVRDHPDLFGGQFSGDGDRTGGRVIDVRQEFPRRDCSACRLFDQCGHDGCAPCWV